MRAVIEALKTAVALVSSPALGQYQQLEGHKLLGFQIINGFPLDRGFDRSCLSNRPRRSDRGARGDGQEGLQQARGLVPGLLDVHFVSHSPVRSLALKG